MAPWPGRRPGGAVVGASITSAGPRGLASVLAFAPEEITVQTESEVAGVLVLAEPWYPGWQATVDDAPGAGLLLAGTTLSALSVLARRDRRGIERATRVGVAS